MPWAHCDVGFILDTEDCPACGLSKAAWTLQVDQTRVLMIGRKKTVEAWIEVELRDDKDRPVAGERYACEFANGRIKTGALDDAGWTKIKPIFPGTCTITFPDLAEPPHTLATAAARGAPSLGPWGRGAAQSRTQPVGASPSSSTAPASKARGEAPDEKTYKSSVTLRTRFRSLERAQADLAAHPIEVRLNGERIPAGAFVASAQETRVQFRLPPGEHELLISSQAEGARRVLLSQRLRVSGPENGHNDDDAAATKTATEGDNDGAGSGHGAGAGVTRTSARARSSTPHEGDASTRVEVIEITLQHVEQGGGRRHVFRLPGSGLKASLPLRLQFRSLKRAQAWLAKHPIQVALDGERVACGVVLESPRQARVQFRLSPGEHHLLVSSQADRERVVYLSQTLTVAGS